MEMAMGKTPDMGVGLGERFDFTATFRYVFGRVFFFAKPSWKSWQLSFHRLFCYLGRFPPNPMILSTIPSGDDEREVETLKECRNPSAIGSPNMLLGQIFPIPHFCGGFDFASPKKTMKFPGFGCFFIRV